MYINQMYIKDKKRARLSGTGNFHIRYLYFTSGFDVEAIENLTGMPKEKIIKVLGIEDHEK